MNKHYKLLFAFLFISVGLFAQQKRHCYQDEATTQYMAAHPETVLEHQKAEQKIQDYLAAQANKPSQKSGNITFTIPIVVHIVHEYGPENIPNSHVYAMIDEINLDYQKLAADTAQIASAFAGIAGDAEIQFRLATKDPQGNCTNGITRTYDPVFTNHGGCPNGNCGTSRFSWPKEKYLNVWVVKDIGSGAGAYAYLAQSNVPEGLDGIVCRYSQFSPLSTFPNSRTMTHEIGHYLNLYHTWGPGNSQGVPTNCNIDDLVFDTPNCVGTSGGCNLNRTSCGSLDNIQNHMDYANCPRMFTDGQVARMQAAINVGLSQRNNLVTPSNLLATGTDDASYANITPCAPIAEFISTEDITCSGSPVQFRDGSYNGDVDSTWTYAWDFPGATPSTSTDRNPVVAYNAVGSYDVTLTVSNSAGTSAPVTKTNVIDILEGAGSFIAPYVDIIDDPTWPNTSDPSLSYDVIKPSGSLFQFQRSTNAFYTPPASIYLNNFGYNGDGVHELITPVMNLSALPADSAFLNFQVAYSKRATENEIIFLYVSDNCGQSWALEEIILSNTFVTAGPMTSSFVPADTSEWKLMSYNIGNHAGKPNVQFAFRFDADNGNNLWLDDIAASYVPEGVVLQGISDVVESTFNIYPNPNEGQFKVDFYRKGNENVTISIVDILGQRIDLPSNLVKEGWNSINIDKDTYGLESGLYFVNLENETGRITKRVIIE